MNSKRPYKHILKNLFHEQATEIIPLLLPNYQVTQVLDIEMPELRTTEIAGPVDEMEEGFVGHMLPGTQVLSVMQTEWIEHSGKFERIYRIKTKTPETDKPSYFVIEFQLEPDDAEQLPRTLLRTYVQLLQHAIEEARQKDDDNEDFEDEDEEEGEEEDFEDEDDIEDDESEQKDTIKEQTYYTYATALCPFPQAVPAPIRSMVGGELTLAFNFKILSLWEKDAREFLNTHVSASYFLLPAMKNADATLLGLAIDELAQRFQSDDVELGRHLTGLSLMLHQSETIAEAEKLLAQEHLQPFAHLLKHDPDDE